MSSYSGVTLKLGSLLLIVSMVTMSAAPSAKAAVTCGDVVRNLTPCISYVLNGGAVPVPCCSGVKTLYGAAQTSGDRQNVCRCIKSTVSGSGAQISGNSLGLAAGLPDKCGVHLPYKISPSTDCDKVQ